MRSIAVMLMLLLSGLLLPTVAAESVAYPPCEIIGNADVMFVMDRSGSMGTQPMQDSKNGANMLLGQLASNDYSSLVSYSSLATLDKGLDNIHTGATNPASTESAVNTMMSGGGTDIASGIIEAHNELLNSGRSYAGWFMIVLSDGQSGNTAATHAAANAAKADGIVIFTIGYGVGVNQVEMQGAASQPSYYYNPTTASQLLTVFSNLRDLLVTDPYAEADAYDVFVEVTEPNFPGGAAVRMDKLNFVDAPNDEHLDVVPFTLSSGSLYIFGEVLHASATASNGTHRADAAASAQIVDFGINYNGVPLVRADLLRSEVSAYAMNGASGTTSEGETLGVEVRGQQVVLSGERFSVHTTMGYIVFDEEITTSSNGAASSIRNAFHAYLESPLGETIEIIVSHAHAVAACADGAVDPTDPPTDDPAVPTCVLGTPVEPGVDHANDVEVDICPPPCDAESPNPPGFDQILPRIRAAPTDSVSLPIFPGAPGPEQCCDTPRVEPVKGAQNPQVTITPRAPDPCGEPCKIINAFADVDCGVPCTPLESCPVDPCVLLEAFGIRCSSDPCVILGDLGFSCPGEPCEIMDSLGLRCPEPPCDSITPNPCEGVPCLDMNDPTTWDLQRCLPDVSRCRDLIASDPTRLNANDVRLCVYSVIR